MSFACRFLTARLAHESSGVVVLLFAATLFVTAAPASAQDTAEPVTAQAPLGQMNPDGCMSTLVQEPRRDHFLRPSAAGCGVHDVDDDVSLVTELRIVEIVLNKHHTIVRFVLLDDAKRRVVFRLSQQIRHEFILKKTQKGVTNLRRSKQQDGVYELKLGPNALPEPCEMHFFLRFDNGTEVLEEWVDDWMYLC